MQLTEQQEEIIARGISQLPPADQDHAVAYILSVLRPIREVTDTDVRHAVASALVKYKS